jgi:ribosomal protein S18 acetylase RimI-like enzyme
MPDVTIRPIEYSRDAPGLKSFLVERDRMRLDHCEHAVNDGDCFIVVAESDGAPVGWVAVHTNFREDQDWDPPDDDTRAFQGGENAYVENIEVTAGARGNGIGRKLLAAAQDEARKRGKRVLWLHTSENNALAHALFEREGWTYERSVFPPWKPTSRTRIYKKVL